MPEPVHFAFPYALDSRGRTASASEAEHIRDLIEQILFTAPGERVNRPDFGSGVLQLIFAPNSPELAATLQFTVQAAVQRWMSDLIDMRELEVTAIESTLAITMTYVIRRTQVLETSTFQRTV